MTMVLRGAAFLCLLLGAGLPYAALPQTAPTDVPEKLKAPAVEELILESHATGWQIYVCQARTDQKLAWVFKAPEADLHDARGATIGSHYAGPAWKLSADRSEVTGKVIARQDAPSADSIPWLLLTATGHSGDGTLTRVTTIQRLHTKGGQPPPDSCDASHSGTEAKRPYSADYYFYAPPH